MRSWIQPLEADAVSEGHLYFLGRNAAAVPHEHWYFDATDSKGRRIMATKPGMANQFIGSEKLKEVLRKHPDFRAIPVPDNAKTRWKRR